MGWGHECNNRKKRSGRSGAGGKPDQAVLGPSVNHYEECAGSEAISPIAETCREAWSRIMVGMALMWVRRWNSTGCGVKLAVDRGHPRMDFAGMLISELARLAAEPSLRSIIVETQPANSNAMYFYPARGFRLCGYNDRYYTNTQNTSKDIAVFFYLDL